ncbi:MAG TPA: hypothetical protein VKA87_06575, partial [Nitrososphaeraceae archaeon]|nr:hypothetical protein [Nitrososphaeraceae archaeon]
KSSNGIVMDISSHTTNLYDIRYYISYIQSWFTILRSLLSEEVSKISLRLLISLITSSSYF